MNFNGRREKNVQAVIAIASLLLAIVGPFPLTTVQKLLLVCFLSTFLFLITWPPRGAVWNQPLIRLHWLDPNQIQAKSQFRNFRWAMTVYRSRLGMSLTELSRSSQVALWKLVLFRVFSHSIPSETIRGPLLFSLMLPKGSFEHGCRCDRATAIRRLSWYHHKGRGAVWTHNRDLRSVTTKELQRMLKKTEADLRAQRRGGRDFQ